jgi:drug/metabolite transporter (DMT)-like permease
MAVPLLLLSAVVVRESPRLPTPTQALALAYLATVLTVGAFLAWFTGLRRLGVDRAGLFVGVLPVSTLVITALVDHRLPGLSPTVGVLLVAAGLAVGMTYRRRSADSSAQTLGAHVNDKGDSGLARRPPATALAHDGGRV